jgi:transposase
MNHRAGIDRQQSMLLPETVEDYIVAEHPVRFLDAFVSSLDLQDLGFGKAVPRESGRPPYDPADLLRLYLYGYLHRVRSSRRLERECQRNLEVLWLMRKLAPDHKTIADFRKDNLDALRGVWRQFTLLCQKLELFGGELVGIDGTKIAGVNSRDRNFNDTKLKERIAAADARIAEYLAALNSADAQEGAGGGTALGKDGLQEKIAALKEQQAQHEALRQQLKASGEKQLSLTDPDARRMTTRQGTVVGYNAQSVVDAKHKLIAAAEVTSEVTDHHQLARMALQAKENLGVEKLEVVADSGYCDNDEVRQCVEAGITPHTPKPDTSANTKAGLFGKSAFSYDAQKDEYHCPGGAVLNYRFSTREKDRELRYYRTRACRQCPIKARCTRDKDKRTITREANEALMDQMAARIAAQPEKLRQRKALCEHPFGTMKRAWGCNHFLMKGIAKVRAEWSLITLAYNLRRALSLVSFATLMGSVRG